MQVANRDDGPAHSILDAHGLLAAPLSERLDWKSYLSVRHPAELHFNKRLDLPTTHLNHPGDGGGNHDPSPIGYQPGKS